MCYEDGNYLTEKGRCLLAKLLASKAKIEFTRAALGSGSIPDGQSPRDMTDLINWQVNGIISDITTPIPGEAHLIFQVFSRDVPVGFLATEAAIWAKDPDEGEILYTYIVISNNPEWIRAAGDPVQKFAEFTCINLVGSAVVDNTSISFEAIVTLPYLRRTLGEFKEEITINLNKKPDIHVISERMRDKAKTDYGFVGSGEFKLRLNTGEYTGTAEIAVVCEDNTLLDAKNMTQNVETARCGDFIVKGEP